MRAARAPRPVPCPACGGEVSYLYTAAEAIATCEHGVSSTIPRAAYEAALRLLTVGIDRKLCYFIRDYTEAGGYPPSVREIAFASGLTLGQAWHRINRLVRQGYITKGSTSGACRTLRVVRMPEVRR